MHVVTRPTTFRDSPLRPLMTVKGEELWYDRSRDRVHVVSGQNGAVHDSVGPPRPPVTPALEFVLHYRSDLADGNLRDSGRGVVQNRSVIWLRSSAYRVAIDPVSYQPLWVTGTHFGQNTLVQLVVAQTKPYDPADFLTAKQKKPRHL